MSTLTSWIGNDVVDLADASLSGKIDNPRFLKRVFTASEQASIVTAEESFSEMWHIWACKEAAYKAFSKTLSAPPTFIHCNFEVSLTSAVDKQGSLVRGGSVLYQGLSISVSVSLAKNVLHACAWTGALSPPPNGFIPADLYLGLAQLDEPGAPWSAPYPELLQALTPYEQAGVLSRESAAVRIGLRASVAEMISVSQEHLQVVRPPRGTLSRGHPVLLLNGKQSSIDISISHHGSWISWAFILRKEY